MSSGAMLGLLEGLGKGMAIGGEAITKNSLAEAEDARRMNLERIKRDWANQDWQRNVDTEQAQHARDRGEKVEDWSKNVVLEQTQHDRDRGEKVSDFDKNVALEQTQHARNRSETVADQGTTFANQKNLILFNRDNPAVTEYDKKLQQADDALAAGTITQKEYNQITLGLGKTDAFTTKDAATLKISALKQASAEHKDDLKFQQLDEGKKNEIISTRAAEIYNQAMGVSSPASMSSQGGKIVEQNGKQYQLSADGKSATLITPMKTSSSGNNSSTSSSVDNPMQRKVQYQIDMGDTRSPEEIAAALKNDDKGLLESNAPPPPKPVEDINSLSPAVKNGIISQAQNIQSIEGGRRSLETIIQAILKERSLGQ